MTPSEVLYAALRTPLGLVLRAGDGERLRTERSRLARADEAMRELAVLGPDQHAQVWLVRKDKLRALLTREKESPNA